jgi:hypothetical protein
VNPLPTVSCADVEPLLPLIADGVIDAAAEPGVFAHLAGCPHCQEALLNHDLVTIALAGAPIPPRRRARTIPWPWAAAAAAGLVAAVALAWPPPPGSAAPPSGTDGRTAAGPVPAPAAAGDRPGIEVLIVPGDRPGTSITILRRGDAVVVVEPRPTADDAQPVGYRRY